MTERWLYLGALQLVIAVLFVIGLMMKEKRPKR